MKEAKSSILEFADEMGYGTDSMLDICCDYINEINKGQDFYNYLKEISEGEDDE